LHLLREIRGAIGALETKLASNINRNHEELTKRIDSIRQAMPGESVLGRYATAEFENGFPPSNNAFPRAKAEGDFRAA